MLLFKISWVEIFISCLRFSSCPTYDKIIIQEFWLCKVFSRIIKNSCAENNVNECKASLLRTLQTGIKNTNPLIKNLSRLLRKNLGAFMRVSTVSDLSLKDVKLAIFLVVLIVQRLFIKI